MSDVAIQILLVHTGVLLIFSLIALSVRNKFRSRYDPFYLHSFSPTLPTPFASRWIGWFSCTAASDRAL